MNESVPVGNWTGKAGAESRRSSQRGMGETMSDGAAVSHLKLQRCKVTPQNSVQSDTIHTVGIVPPGKGELIERNKGQDIPHRTQLIGDFVYSPT